MTAFLIITHRTAVNGIIKNGGIDLTADFLKKRGFEIYFIEHPLDHTHKHSYFKKISENSSEIILKKTAIFPKFIPFCWFLEFLFNFFYPNRFIKGKINIIAVDPLNFFSAYFLKIIGKAEKIFFHSVDYSKIRFQNKFLNSIYQFFYNFSVKKSDTAFAVTLRMFEHCRKISGKNNIFFLPNSPDFSSLPKVPIGERNKCEVTISSGGEITEILDFDLILKILKKLKEKFPSVKLNIIGRLNEAGQKTIKNWGLENNVIIFGHQPHKKSLAIASKSYIGLSIYNNKVPNIYWGDSLKIREFAAMGLPIISDRKTSTAFEMAENGAGEALDSEEKIVSEIEKLFLDEKYYQKISSNALNWAKKMDRKIILQNFLDYLEINLKF